MYKKVHALAIVFVFVIVFVVCFDLRCHCIAASESSQNSLSLIKSWLHGAIILCILSKNVVHPIWSVCIPIHFVWNGNSYRSHNAVRLCSDLRSLTSRNATLFIEKRAITIIYYCPIPAVLTSVLNKLWCSISNICDVRYLKPLNCYSFDPREDNKLLHFLTSFIWCL